MSEENVKTEVTEPEASTEEPVKEPVPDLNKVLQDFHSRGLRVYYSDEKDFTALVTMLLGFGMNAKGITRMVDVIVFTNRTVIEIEGFDKDDRIVANTLFMMGQWFQPKRSTLLKRADEDEKKVE